MKKIALLGFCVFITFSIFAQTDSTKILMIYPKNFIKFNLSPLLFHTANIQYERKINNQFSITLNGIYRPSSRILKMLKFENSYLSNYTLSVVSLTPAVRFYISKQMKKRFYTELYYRIRKDDFAISEGQKNNFNNADFKGTEIINNLGLLFGCQLLKNKNLCLDFWILGVGVGTSKVKGTTYFGNNYLLTDDTKKNYENNFNKISNREYVYQWDSRNLSISNNTTTTFFRGLGFSIGVFF